ncbi:MAG: glycerophosphoryl diester phosphodiesterase membrane domain-containing protein [Salinibacterium sp.]|nr:glycerophosphoryl diester phosphodiesterase membrane domain-containing protein [Salinibacterium sp.]
MTDNTPWQSPSGVGAASTPTPYGSAGNGPVPQPAAPGTGTGTGGGGGWAPPPKPGLVPLRPLAFPTILAAAFQVMRRNPGPTFGFALLITGVIVLVSSAVVGLVTVLAFSRTFNAAAEDLDTITAGSVALVVLAAVVPVVLSIVVASILQGIVSLEVARATLGEKLKLSGLWRSARGRIGALIGWSALVTAVVLVAFIIVAAVIGLLIALGGPAGIAVGVILGLLAGLGAAALFIWLGTKLALVPSVLMLERTRLADAVRRSWSLTNNYFWKTFGIILLVNVIVQTVASVISFPLSVVAGFGGALLDPSGSSEGFLVISIIVTVLSVVISVVFGAIALVAQSATPALLYIDIRMRKEGLDLELLRFVEARQTGDASVTDPYLVPSTRPVPPQSTSATAGTSATAATEQQSPWS